MSDWSSDYSFITCCSCGCRFGVPKDYEQGKRNNKETFYCPNGHPLSYKESEADKLRRERDRLAQRLAEKDDSIRFERERREQVEKRLSATRGVVTRIRKRVGNGVCPCCTRSFTNLRSHMATEHPEWKAEAAE
jgi:hypothetical protein